MASSDASPAPGAVKPQRHLSGMLLLSLFLSIGGLLVVPIIGGLGGLIFSILGRKRVLKNPLLIGPNFALMCIAVAVVSLPLQGWRVYTTLPQIGYMQCMGDIRTGFFARLENRDWPGVYDAMHVDYRDTHRVEDVTAILSVAFPGEDEIKLTEENLLFHQPLGEEERKQESERFMAFLDGEGEIFDFDLDCSVLFPVEKEQVDMGLRVRVHRLGYMSFKARVLDLDATRGPLKEEEPTEPDQAGDEETDGATPGEPGEQGNEEPGEVPDKESE